MICAHGCPYESDEDMELLKRSTEELLKRSIEELLKRSTECQRILMKEGVDPLVVTKCTKSFWDYLLRGYGATVLSRPIILWQTIEN